MIFTERGASTASHLAAASVSYAPISQTKHLLRLLPRVHPAEPNTKVIRQHPTNISSHEHQRRHQNLRNNHPRRRSIRTPSPNLPRQTPLHIRPSAIPHIRAHRKHHIIHERMGDGRFDFRLHRRRLAVRVPHSLLCDHDYRFAAAGHYGGDGGDEPDAEEVVARFGGFGGGEERAGDAGGE